MTNISSSDYKIVLPSTGIYYNLRGTRSPLGPISFKELQKKFFTREVNSTTYVWHKNLSNWITLGECRDFDILPSKNPIEVSSLEQDHAVDKTITASLNNQEKIFKLDQVAQAVHGGHLTPSTPVFSYEHNKWIRAGHHKSLVSIFKRVAAQKNGLYLHNESLDASKIIFDGEIDSTESTRSLKPEINDDSVLSLNIPKLNVKKTTANLSIPPLVNQKVSTKVQRKEDANFSDRNTSSNTSINILNDTLSNSSPKVEKSENENVLKQRRIKNIFPAKNNKSKSKISESSKSSIMLWCWAIILMVFALIVSSLAYFPDKVMGIIDRFSFFRAFF